jgi:predicted RNA binding protein YcfA (HicA-like mRNA interferase family)
VTEESSTFSCGSEHASAKAEAMKVREIIRIIESDGWHRVRAKSGHLQYKHATKKGRVTISGHRNDDIHPRTLNSILKQAGLK